MNTLFLKRSALLAAALATAGFTTAFADDATSTTAPSDAKPACAKSHHALSGLTDDEKAQLKKDHEAALAADPSLQTDEANLKQKAETLKSQGTNASADDRSALHQDWKAFHDKMRAAMIKADPSVEPVLAKMEANHKAMHHHHSEDATNTAS